MADAHPPLWPTDAVHANVISARVSAPAEELFDKFFKLSDISAELHKERGDNNVKESAWVSSRDELPGPQFGWEAPSQKSDATPKLNWYRKALFDNPPTAMSSKPFMNEEMQHCAELSASEKYIVDIQANTSAPYGNKFNLFFRYQIYRLTPTSSAVLVSFYVQFLPGMNRMLKPVVSRAVDGGVQGTFKTLRKVLGNMFECEDVADAALMQEVHAALPDLPAEPKTAPQEYKEPTVTPKEIPEPLAGRPHAPVPRNLVDFFSDQLVYQEQVTLLSEVVSTGIKKISDLGVLARLIGGALTVWLIHLAVLVCNGVKSVCSTAPPRILWPFCWPVNHLIDLPDSTGEVLSSLLLVAVLNWGAIQGWELLAEHLREHRGVTAASEPSSVHVPGMSASTSATASNATKATATAAAASTGNKQASKSTADSERASPATSEASAPTAAAPPKAPIRSAPPAKPFPESVKKMVQDNQQAKASSKQAAIAAATAAAAAAAAGNTTAALVPDPLQVVPPGAGSMTPMDVMKALLSPTVKAPQSIEMGSMGSKPREVHSSSQLSGLVSPPAAEVERSRSSLDLDELIVSETSQVAVSGGSKAFGDLNLPKASGEAHKAKPADSGSSMVRRKSLDQGGDGLEGSKSGPDDDGLEAVDKEGSLLSLHPDEKHEAKPEASLASAGPVQVRRAQTMLYDVMPASKRPNYVVGLSKSADLTNMLDPTTLASLHHRDMVVEEIFENERFQPFRGWGHLWPGHFLPSDRVGHWSDRQGRPGGSASMNFEQVVPQLPSEEEWYWLDADWVLDLDGLEPACVCPEGWGYALDFNYFKFPNMPGSGKCTMKHFVRRRRWIRTRARTVQRGTALKTLDAVAEMVKDALEGEEDTEEGGGGMEEGGGGTEGGEGETEGSEGDERDLAGQAEARVAEEYREGGESGSGGSGASACEDQAQGGPGNRQQPGGTSPGGGPDAPAEDVSATGASTMTSAAASGMGGGKRYDEMDSATGDADPSQRFTPQPSSTSAESSTSVASGSQPPPDSPKTKQTKPKTGKSPAQQSSKLKEAFLEERHSGAFGSSILSVDEELQTLSTPGASPEAGTSGAVLDSPSTASSTPDSKRPLTTTPRKKKSKSKSRGEADPHDGQDPDAHTAAVVPSGAAPSYKDSPDPSHTEPSLSRSASASIPTDLKPERDSQPSSQGEARAAEKAGKDSLIQGIIRDQGASSQAASIPGTSPPAAFPGHSSQPDSTVSSPTPSSSGKEIPPHPRSATTDRGHVADHDGCAATSLSDRHSSLDVLLKSADRGRAGGTRGSSPNSSRCPTNSKNSSDSTKVGGIIMASDVVASEASDESLEDPLSNGQLHVTSPQQKRMSRMGSSAPPPEHKEESSPSFASFVPPSIAPASRKASQRVSAERQEPSSSLQAPPGAHTPSVSASGRGEDLSSAYNRTYNAGSRTSAALDSQNADQRPSPNMSGPEPGQDRGRASSQEAAGPRGSAHPEAITASNSHSSESEAALGGPMVPPVVPAGQAGGPVIPHQGSAQVSDDLTKALADAAMKAPRWAMAPPGGAMTPPGGGMSPPGEAMAPPGGVTKAPGGGMKPPGGAMTPPGGAMMPPGSKSKREWNNAPKPVTASRD